LNTWLLLVGLVAVPVSLEAEAVRVVSAQELGYLLRQGLLIQLL
jgi:hypothetical protein